MCSLNHLMQNIMIIRTSRGRVGFAVFRNVRRVAGNINMLHGDASVIEIFGSAKMSVDGCLGVLAYSETMAILKLVKKNLIVSGSSLFLKEMSGGSIIIEGDISAVQFESNQAQLASSEREKKLHV